MSSPTTLRERLDYVIQRSGRPEGEVIAEAFQTGLRELYEEELTEAYLLGEVDRETIVRELGEERVQRIDHTREYIDRDVQWGLHGL